MAATIKHSSMEEVEKLEGCRNRTGADPWPFESHLYSRSRQQQGWISSDVTTFLVRFLIPGSLPTTSEQGLILNV